ncbi:bifunctional methylenetetrahydrofolate dehydrogenase/methenyltetrahydrofolate cyclohydrolase FolD [Planctomicrobium piriforme]|uniref:Bifunctional protein FolD n=1 Tax=Planctomicrobium piriforme TaxID=1576369 RepID=A0A1I3C694_9PLAN|nr:bifunctional methylenetetrahydrofolate dehydrogenase/methenyltetrahydrofolate cyclohydrolase FolD [Planctomicrobium piriforme]SFH70078.1 methylenetetrahydrofolate dehydrogenase (NADP+) / methenyltetrahydrofolate cyclohydrolase [Planctomicrobium piriforme]
MTAKLIDGKATAARLNALLATKVAEFKSQTGVSPHLAAVLVGDDPASAVYVRNKQRSCASAGMLSSLHQLGSATTQSELLDLIAALNADASVHGILVQLPLPKQIDETTVLDAVTPLKDVDCFHPENVGLMVQGRPRFLPCTPAGCQYLITESGFETAGKHAVVIGRSEIVGKPMALMLVQKGRGADATVTIAHSRTKNLAEISRQADLLIAAVGRPNTVTADMVKPGACVIDVGTNRVDGKLVGDVDFAAVLEIAGAITPVPGGVGPMTIAMLMENTLTAARLQTES